MEVTHLLPQLHNIFVQKGTEPEFWVFDACELARGAGVPVATRYIWAIDPNSGQDDEKIRKIHPGVLISDIRGQIINVQIGLDNEDLWKIGQRARAVVDQEGIDILFKPPDWWNYPFRGVNFSRPYNKFIDNRYFDRNLDRTGAIDLDSFVWGKTQTPDEMVVFNFPQDLENNPRLELENEWEKRISEGLESLSKVI